LSYDEPQYVLAIDTSRNAIIVGCKADVYGDELIASGLHWIEFDALEQSIEVKAKIRYRHREGDAVVRPLASGEAHVKFAQPQMAITPGQSVVFYKGSVVVGGGTIERVGGV
jgi:tRNA-specific 2-thiouridylase